MVLGIPAWAATLAVWGTVGALVGVLFEAPSTEFCPDACSRLATALVGVDGVGVGSSGVVGQELALQAIVDAVCEHIDLGGRAERPLVLSFHGPVGVGKSHTQKAVADALFGCRRGRGGFGAADRAGVWAGVGSSSFPPTGGGGYLSLAGTDWGAADREVQATALAERLARQVTVHPASLVVVEDYDKMSCAARAVLRHAMDHGRVAHEVRARRARESGAPLGAPGGGPGAEKEEAQGRAAFGGAVDTGLRSSGAVAGRGGGSAGAFVRSILVLESNLGYGDLVGFLADAGAGVQRSGLNLVDAQRRLRDRVYAGWEAQACEDAQETHRSVSLVDFYVPFLPLEREHVRAVFAGQLEARSLRGRRDGTWSALAWDDDVLDWMAANVEYEALARKAAPREGNADGSEEDPAAAAAAETLLPGTVEFSLDGAREVRPVLTMLLGPALRRAGVAPASAQQPGDASKAYGRVVRLHVDTSVPTGIAAQVIAPPPGSLHKPVAVPDTRWWEDIIDAVDPRTNRDL